MSALVKDVRAAVSAMKALAAVPEPEQLYDIAWGPKADPGKAKFMMRAPMRVVVCVLDLRTEAKERLLRETQTDGGICLLYGVRRFGIDSVFAVMKARVPLEASR